jgi:hypothetical protein
MDFKPTCLIARSSKWGEAGRPFRGHGLLAAASFRVARCEFLAALLGVQEKPKFQGPCQGIFVGARDLFHVCTFENMPMVGGIALRRENIFLDIDVKLLTRVAMKLNRH